MQITLVEYCTLLLQALKKYREECPLLPTAQNQFWGFDKTYTDGWCERYPNSFRSVLYKAIGKGMDINSFGQAFNPRYPIVEEINELTKDTGLGALSLPDKIWLQLEWILHNKAKENTNIKADFLSCLSQYAANQTFIEWQHAQNAAKNKPEIAHYRAYFWTVLRDDLWEARFEFCLDEDNEIKVKASHLFANDPEHISTGHARKGEDDIIEIDLVQSRLNHSANIKAYSTPLLHFPNWGIFAGHYLAVSGNPGRPITVRPIVFVPAEKVTDIFKQALREKLLHLRRDTENPSVWWKIGPEFLMDIQGLVEKRDKEGTGTI